MGMPKDHKAYDAAIAQARKLADANPKASVFLQMSKDGSRIRVDLKAEPDWEMFAIAQVWDEKTVQFRFGGARSEFTWRS